MPDFGYRKAIGALGLIGALSGLAGCGSSDDGEAGGISTTTAEALSGVYQVTHFTRNEAGCDAEGPSILDGTQDQHFVLEAMMVLGDRVVVLASCNGVEDCQQTARAIRSKGSYGNEYNFLLTREVSGTHVAGFEASTGHGGGAEGMCVERVYSDHDLTILGGGTIEFESRTKLLADQPQRDGACSVTPAESKAEAAGLPCSTLRVLEGARIADAS